jgi:hypothetical protein
MNEDVMAGKPAPSRLPTLGERLSWITGQVDPIVASGMDQFKNVAMSIEDIENAIRPLLAEAGVVTRWSLVSDEHFKDGNQTLWKTLLHVTVFRDDDAKDCIEADWSDIGTSPTAAHSFTVKGYYRRLFHLGASEDELKQAAGPAKPKNVQQAVKQIAQTYGDPGQPAQSATSPQPTGDGADPTLASTDLLPLAVSIKEPWAEIYLKQELAKHGEASVRRRLVMLHARDHGPACDHVAQLAGLKS